MKRKIFSKLLMGALLVASVSSFVSCKDYDDDINNLQDQINAKAALSELSALQSTLDSKIAAAQSAAQAAQATADKAATATSVAELKAALEKAIADAKQAGTDAGTEAGKAITAANKAQETADAAAAAAKKADEDAKAALAKALEDIKAAYATKAEAAAAATAAATAQSTADAAKTAAEAAQKAADAAKAVADAAYTKAEAEELKKEVEELKSTLEAQIDEKIKEAIQEVNNAAASVDAIWSAVTSVELVASQFGTVYSENFDLLLLTGEEVANVFGGKDNTKSSDLQVAYQDGNDVTGEGAITYTAEKEIDFTNRIIVRVNPANAEIDKDSIILINSLGDETLSNLVEVTKVEDYKQLITRAGVATGLKVVTIVRKDNVSDDAIAAAVEGQKIKATERPTAKWGDAMFALGIKSGEEDRVAYTTFDLDVNYGDYQPVKTLNFYVKGDAADQAYTAIANLKNRWNGAKLVGEDETAETPKAPYTDGWYPEFTWNGANDAAIKAAVPAVDTLWVNADGTKKNFVTGDNRSNRAYVICDAETRTFTIDMNPYLAALGGYAIPGNSHVQYFYVTLDKFAAVESAPSEYQAWKKYEYEGLYKMTPAIDPLKVTVKSEAAIGDIIGFRVFAVNFDGTLVDPDGRSFYVQVGEPAAAITNKFTVEVTANTANNAPAGNYATVYADLDNATQLYNSGIVPFTLPENFLTTATFPATTLAGTAFTIATTGQTDKVQNTVNGKYYLLQDEKGLKAATNWSNLKYIAIDIQQIERIVDNQTVATNIRFSGTDADHHDKEVNIVTVDVKKLLPTGPKNFSWKSGAPITGNTLNLFMTPAAAIGGAPVWNASAAFGWVNLSTYCNNLNAQYRFRFADANVLDNGAYENAVDAPATAATKGKSVYVKSAKITGAGTVNDGAWLLGLQGPANAGLIAAGKDTYVDGAKTSGLKVQYTYATNISLKRNAANTGFVGPTAPTVDIATNVTQAKFTYALADNTYRAVKYESAKTWTAPTATPTVYAAGTWNAASNNYVLLYDGTDGTTTFAAGAALQPAVVATKLPLDNTAAAPVAYRWQTDDAAIAAPGNAWTDQVTYEGAGDRQAIIPAAGNAVAAYSAGYASIIQLNKFVIVNNSQYEASNNIPFDKNMFIAAPTITFKSDANGVNNEYYDAAINWAGALSILNFAPKAVPVAIPTIDVPATVVITGEDAFGQDQVITLPFTITK